MKIFNIFKKNKKEVTSEYTEFFNYIDEFKKYRVILEKYCDTKFDRWIDLTQCSLNVGDIAIIDKYNILNGANTWDGGARSIETTGLYPFEVEITDVRPTKILAYDKIEKFLNWIDIYKNSNDKKLISDYEHFCEKSTKFYGMVCNNIYGFYYEASYKPIDSTIKIPLYYLNSNSFFTKDNKGFEETKKIWELETTNYYNIKRVKEYLSDLERKKEEIKDLIKKSHDISY